MPILKYYDQATETWIPFTNTTLGNASTLETKTLAQVVQQAVLASHPVGEIYISTSSANPSTYLGGTWVAWGSGRVPVGVDTGQTEFNTVEKTGGAKTHTLTTTEMPVHKHGLYWEGGADSDEGFPVCGFNAVQTTDRNYTLASEPIAMANAGGGGAHNNLQPYITCYMWKRTA